MPVQHYIGNSTTNRHIINKNDKVVDIEDILESIKEDGDFSKYLRIRSSRSRSRFRYEYPKIMRKEKEVYSYHYQKIKKDGCCLICMDDIKKNNTLSHLCGISKRRPIIRSCCKQFYHTDCYFKWLDENHICPICKNILMTVVILKSSNGRYKVNSYCTSSYKCYNSYGEEIEKDQFLKQTKIYKVIYLHK